MKALRAAAAQGRAHAREGDNAQHSDGNAARTRSALPHAGHCTPVCARQLVAPVQGIR